MLQEHVLQSATWTRDEWLPGSLDIIPEPGSGLGNFEGSDQRAYWNSLHDSTFYSPWTLSNYSNTSGTFDYKGRLTYWGPDRQGLELLLPAGWERNKVNNMWDPSKKFAEDFTYAISF